jgi:leucyl-tRNA synthetase
MTDINFKKIEEKWQKVWEEKQAFKSFSSKKEKCYVLEMFPYPSGAGLHMGHAFNYTIGDIFARYKRMNNFNVMYPAGYDAFGLPAENAAIKAKEHPSSYTKKSIKNFISQQKSLGLSYDWSKLVITCEPKYYKWNQYFFLKFLEKGLIYRKESSANWCSKCNTVLANEQVHDGKCWRHEDTEIEIKKLDQWSIKTTAYAGELHDDIQKLDWPNRIKFMQKNWIGKSHGVEINFKLENSDTLLPSYTTRCDTIYSVTFLAIAPENPLVLELVKGTKYETATKKFIEKTKKQTAIDRENAEKEKEGVFLGKYAINPVNDEKIPIYTANFALMYGSGIVMCDAHDKRDFKFAEKYKIPLKFVISSDGHPKDPRYINEAFTDDGILFDSGEFSGMKNREALPKIANWIEKNNYGKKVINYKLRDWLVSRQRYWGTPIPIVYCNDCGIVPVPEKDLPVILPEKVKFGKGNPLATNKEFLNVKCPKCSKDAKRETDTMDTFFDSSWYFLRYCDNENSKKPFDRKKVNYWMPVNKYIGGAEHACMHLIYARFFTKVLRDLELVDIDEPFTSLFNQGMLHAEDGRKMSKSLGNIVLPETVSKEYGIDTARLFLVSIASPDKDLNWDVKGVQGSLRFIKKVFDYMNNVKISKSSEKLQSKLHLTIKDVSKKIENFEYNLAVIKIRELFDSFEAEIDKKDLESFLKLLSPFCPHLAEEFWSKIGNKSLISLESWPKFDESKMNKKFEFIERSLENTISDILNVLNIIKEKGKEASTVYLYIIPKDLENFNEEEISKRVHKEVKVFLVNDPKKHDPENKSQKAKPGKPGIYVE